MKTEKTSLKHKLVFLISSTIFTLIFLEIVLRLGGSLLLSFQQQNNKAALNHKGIIVIMCIGESTTFMGKEDSYPSQLEKFLNQDSKQQIYKVINKGVPGIGSKYILENVESWINEYKPDFIITMMGINDHNKLIPLDQATASDSKLSFLLNLRVYKLFSWIKKSLKNRADNKPASVIALENQQTKPEVTDLSVQEPLTFEGLVNDKIKTSPEKYKNLYIAGLILKGEGELEKAEQIFKALINWNYDSTVNTKLYYELGDILIAEGKYGQLTGVLKYLLSNPSNPQAAKWINQLCSEQKGTNEISALLSLLIQDAPDTAPFYDLLGGCLSAQGKIQLASDYFTKANQLRTENLNPITYANFMKLADIISKHNIYSIFVQYPFRDVEILKTMLKTHPKYATFTFMSNKENFQEELEKGSYDDLFIDRFAGDFGHCTKRGNRLIAENIAEVFKDKF